MTLLSVPDMTCAHCRTAVEGALAPLPGAGAVAVDLAAKEVRVSGTTAPETLIAALEEIGYPARLLAAG